jgi:hypothetical protein
MSTIDRRPIGRNQRMALDCLVQNRHWQDPDLITGYRWSWHIDGTANTRRILDSLVKRGLAIKSDGGDYTITDAGRTSLEVQP